MTSKSTKRTVYLSSGRSETNIPSVKKKIIAGSYEVGTMIDKGGMSQVMLCQNRRNKRYYVLKTFQKKDYKDLFEQEMRFTFALDKHPNIVYTPAITKEGDHYYMVMEYIGQPPRDLQEPVRGHTLQTEFDNHKISYLQALQWAIEFCEGMIYLNKRGMSTHNDIKPSNIFITENRVLKIGDFGLSSLKQEKGGTPGYRSPEYFSKCFPTNVQSDIYSFGLVLYQLFNDGKHILPAKYIRKNIKEYEHIDLKNLQSAHCTEIIKKCLQRNMKLRYRNFQELKEDLTLQMFQLNPSFYYLPEFEEMTAEDWFAKGYGYSWIQENVLAITYYNKALALRPSLTSAYNNRSVEWNNLNNKEQVLKDLTQAISWNPEYVLGYRNRGDIYRDEGKYEEALADYNKAIELEPNYINAYNSRGILFERQKEYDKAIADYTQAIKLDDHYVWAYANRGDIFCKQLKKYPEAEADYLKLLEIDPQYISVYDRLIKLYTLLKKPKKVKEIQELKKKNIPSAK